MNIDTKRLYFYISGIISFTIFITFFSSLIYFLSTTQVVNKKYTAKKIEAIDISIVGAEKSKKSVKKTVKKSPKTPRKKTIKRVKLNSLFSDIDTKKYKKTAKKTTKTITKPEKIKIKKENDKNVEKLIDNLLDVSQNTKPKDAIYDKYKGKINDIIQDKWSQTIPTNSGNIATIIATINKNGKFSYDIKSLSKSDLFNTKVEEFLKYLEDFSFPISPDNRDFKLRLELKDK